MRLQDRGLEADLGELGRGVLGGLSLPRARVVARVGGVDPDQVAADADDLVLRGHVVSCHAPMVALGRAGAGWGCAWACRPGIWGATGLAEASGIGRQDSLAWALA